MFAGKDAIVATVWQATAGLGSFAWSGASARMVDFLALDRAAAEDGANVAEAGVRLARKAGLRAEPWAAMADGPVWKAIVEIADHHDAAAIVMGSRGLSGMRAMLLGSVSSAVLQHAERPTLVVRRASAEAEADTDADADRDPLPHTATST